MSDIDISVDFAGIRLKNPVFTASGTCGYADELSDFMDVNLLGGFVTKSITPEQREGNDTPRIVETDAGMLNAIGLANVGLERFISEKIPLIEKMDVPVFVNVAGKSLDEYVTVAKRVASEDAVSGLELNISCPNVKKGGIAFGTDPGQVRKITHAVKKVSLGKPLIVKLTPAVTDISIPAKAAVDGGADALSLVNTFTAMVVDIVNKKPVLANRTGGLSGPAIRPIAVYLVNKVYREVAKPCGVPILGGGGIRTASDALEFIIAGASAVAVGTGNLIEPDAAMGIIAGIEQYCVENGISCIGELTGSLQ